MQKIVMGWIKGDEKVNCEARETTLGCGFVVLDRNGNGTIDNGGELFGDQTLVNGVKAADGFAALSAQDTNANGKFDAGDTNFTNVQIAAGTYTKTNGTTGDSGTLNLTEDTGNAGNLNFSQNPFYSEFTDHLTLTDTTKVLPDMQGSGMVRDLREASMMATSVNNFNFNTRNVA